MGQRFNDKSSAVALGTRIRNARRNAGLSSPELAQRAGVHHSTVIRAEHGRYKTYSHSVQKICTVLSIRFDEECSAQVDELLTRIEILLSERPRLSRVIEAVVEALERESTGRDH